MFIFCVWEEWGIIFIEIVVSFFFVIDLISDCWKKGLRWFIIMVFFFINVSCVLVGLFIVISIFVVDNVLFILLMIVMFIFLYFLFEYFECMFVFVFSSKVVFFFIRCCVLLGVVVYCFFILFSGFGVFDLFNIMIFICFFLYFGYLRMIFFK